MLHIASSFAAELHQEHVLLFGQLAMLEEKAEPGSTDRMGQLVVRLIEARESLQRHFHFEEQGGYMSQVLADAPHLSHAAHDLFEEHGRLSDNLDSLITLVGGISPETFVAPTLQGQVRELVRLVRGHEARENRLIQQACNQDLGSEG
jgi:hypothetical protein